MLRPFVQMMPNETHNAQHFSLKIYDSCVNSSAHLKSSGVLLGEAVADAAADNIKYLELRYPHAHSATL
ncbi:MAG: hypothetical protein R3E39_21695 [Anaerolineae bacterium]